MSIPCIKSTVSRARSHLHTPVVCGARFNVCTGPIVRVGPDEVDVTDLSSVKTIHTVKATYIKSPKFYRALSAPGTESVFSTTDVFFHRRHRKLLSGGFSESSLKLYQPIVEQRVNLAIERMGQEQESRGAADVFKWWLFVSLFHQPTGSSPLLKSKSDRWRQMLLGN